VREVLELHRYTTVLDAVSAPGFALLGDTGDGDPQCSSRCTERRRVYDGSAGPETTYQAFAARLTSAGYRCSPGCAAGAGGNGQLTSWRRAGADLGVDLAVGTAADVADPARGPVAAPDAIIATVTVLPANYENGKPPGAAAAAQAETRPAALAAEAVVTPALPRRVHAHAARGVW
jgi:hypothetical protein